MISLVRFRVVGICVFLICALIAAVEFGAVGLADTESVALVPPIAAVITASKVDTLTPGAGGDVDGDGKADPGDTILYTVTIMNTGTTDGTGTVFTDTIDAHTTLVGGSLSSSAVAVNDTLPVAVVGNVSVNSATLSTPFSVTANDFLGQNPTSTIDAVQAVTTISSGTITAVSSQGGNVVTNVTTGYFTYDPPAGYEGTDNFTYRLSDNVNAASGVANRTATVTINVSGMVWFINNNAASCTTAGCGRLSNPFSTLESFQALNNGTGNNPATGHNIFLYESASAYTGGVTLLASQKLIGQDSTSTLSTITGLTPPTGSSSFPAMNTGGNATTIQDAAGNGVKLGTGNSLNGFTGGDSTGFSILGSSFVTVTVNDVIINTNGKGLSLTNGASGAGGGNFTNNCHRNCERQSQQRRT